MIDNNKKNTEIKTNKPQDVGSGCHRLKTTTAQDGIFLDRKDSYFKYPATKREKTEWFLQSFVPMFGLILLSFCVMMLYEIRATVARTADAAPAMAESNKPFEGCIRVNDFRRNLNRPEVDESLYCDINMGVNNESLYDEIWI